MSLFGQRIGRGIGAIALVGGFVGSGAAVVLASSIPEAGAVPTVSPCPAPVISGTTATVTCSYNGTNGTDGSAQSWTVPAGVTQATFDVFGAQGGGSSGGPGGEDVGTFTVTPGSTYQINVGGQPSGTAAGYNGGGSAGTLGSTTGGGGASDIRDGGYGLADRIAVAGGGGGSAAGSGGGPGVVSGGDGGGADGSSTAGCQYCGGGGTSSAGGPAASVPASSGGGPCDPNYLVSSTVPIAPTSGGSGVGGNGGSRSCTYQNPLASTPTTYYEGGGGGGGGWFGGGGGDGYIGGFTFPNFSTPGGGGSGHIDNSATSPNSNTGVQSGNGEVVITYTVPSDNDLSLSQPANITNVNATSPSGAKVTYSLPTVSDPDDAKVPTPSCTPISGSTFAIGTTTVNCSVSDADDSNSPQATSFTVSVVGAPQQLANLKSASPGSILQGTVGVAASQLAHGHAKLACGALKTYIVEVQVGEFFKLIPVATANQLIASAKNIEAVIPC